MIEHIQILNKRTDITSVNKKYIVSRNLFIYTSPAFLSFNDDSSILVSLISINSYKIINYVIVFHTRLKTNIMFFPYFSKQFFVTIAIFACIILGQEQRQKVGGSSFA